MPNPEIPPQTPKFSTTGFAKNGLPVFSFFPRAFNGPTYYEVDVSFFDSWVTLSGVHAGNIPSGNALKVKIAESLVNFHKLYYRLYAVQCYFSFREEGGALHTIENVVAGDSVYYNYDGSIAIDDSTTEVPKLERLDYELSDPLNALGLKATLFGIPQGFAETARPQLVKMYNGSDFVGYGVGNSDIYGDPGFNSDMFIGDFVGLWGDDEQESRGHDVYLGSFYNELQGFTEQSLSIVSLDGIYFVRHDLWMYSPGAKANLVDITGFTFYEDANFV